MERGVVESFDAEQGWGVITSKALPDGEAAWVHFSAIDGTGFRALTAGDRVEFKFRPANQDGYHYVVTRVRKL
ncbi:cold shock domain-containing protein [Nocardia sp. ET3-3]|uniref:Cold shock domain-containing protein n=1 Tax=Nocardia terrae TaxID=2675851 RepID=A0A7K1V6S3_9NOCA|nr:cold shock domain-containing protein [Nocardia terrae]MVU82172.1 cold shock domain-containing protein [Nocardia terrae]